MNEALVTVREGLTAPAAEVGPWSMLRLTVGRPVQRRGRAMSRTAPASLGAVRQGDQHDEGKEHKADGEMAEGDDQDRRRDEEAAEHHVARRRWPARDRGQVSVWHASMPAIVPQGTCLVVMLENESAGHSCELRRGCRSQGATGCSRRRMR